MIRPSALWSIAAMLVATTPHVASPSANASVAQIEDGPVVLVTGANRGIGLEMARQFKAKGYQVIGTARKPEAADELRSLGVRVEQLDVTDDESARALAESLGGMKVDLLVNNAGIFPREKGGLDSVNFDDAVRAFEVNSVGPLRVTRALLPNLRRGTGKTVVQVSSLMGSIEGNTRGGSYSYRASKTAINSFNRTLSHELGAEGFKCIVVHPGWVRTDMGGPNARLSPEESVSGLVKVIEGLGPEDNGAFFDHSGKQLPW